MDLHQWITFISTSNTPESKITVTLLPALYSSRTNERGVVCLLHAMVGHILPSLSDFVFKSETYSPHSVSCATTQPQCRHTKLQTALLPKAGKCDTGAHTTTTKPGANDKPVTHPHYTTSIHDVNDGACAACVR